MTLEEALAESWAFQELMQKAYDKGFKIGYGIGLQDSSLVLFVEKYYPALSQLAQNICNETRTLEESQSLFKKVMDAKDEEEVHQLLLGAQK